MEPKQIFYDHLLSFLNLPYIYGGDDFSGADCSGFVLFPLQGVGVFPAKKDATAQDLFNYFQKFQTGVPELGTLLFYGTDTSKISHINIALNNAQLIGAEGGDSTTKTVEDAIKRNAFVKILPIGYRGIPIAMLTPPYPWRKL